MQAVKISLKEKKADSESKKKYKNLIKTKNKKNYVTTRRKDLISLGKHNPKGFWRELQQKRNKIDNNILATHWVEYAKLLYKGNKEKSSPPIINYTIVLFSVEDVKRGIKNLVSGKSQDIDGLQA